MENMEMQEVKVTKAKRGHRVMSMLLAVMMVVSAFAVPCFATETVASSADTVLESADTITSLINKVFNLITGNWYLVLFLCLSLLGLGIGGLKMLKRGAH